MMRLLLFFLLLFSFTACSRPDPHPELKDPIYRDMQSELQLAEKNIAEVQKKLAEHQASLKNAKPQTGQTKYFEKKIWETQKILDLLEQQKKYWKIRLEQRLQSTREKSLEAFHQNQSLDFQEEMRLYEAEKRLRRAKMNWDNKERREKALRKAKLMPEPKESGQKSH